MAGISKRKASEPPLISGQAESVLLLLRLSKLPWGLSCMNTRRRGEQLVPALGRV